MADSRVVIHGTRKRYSKGCRCEACRAAETDYTRRYRQRRDKTAADFPHGTHTGYACKCRCSLCVAFKHGYEAEKPPIDVTVAVTVHGAHRGYALGCRCDACGKAEYTYRTELNAARSLDAPDFPHGEVKGYKRGCRCEFCVDAKRLRDGAKHAQRMSSDAEYVARRRSQSRVVGYNRRAAEKATQTDVELVVMIYKACPKGYEVDHIFPLAKGGAHTPDNLQYLPAVVNRRKRDKLNYDYHEHVIRWQDVLGCPSTTIPGGGVDLSGSKCSAASQHEVGDIV